MILSVKQLRDAMAGIPDGAIIAVQDNQNPWLAQLLVRTRTYLYRGKAFVIEHLTDGPKLDLGYGDQVVAHGQGTNRIQHQENGMARQFTVYVTPLQIDGDGVSLDIDLGVLTFDLEITDDANVVTAIKEALQRGFADQPNAKAEGWTT